ncbi:MAG: PHB depolymerase family esterase [Candidatus Paceibacterota bacterium]
MQQKLLFSITIMIIVIMGTFMFLQKKISINLHEFQPSTTSSSTPKTTVKFSSVTPGDYTFTTLHDGLTRFYKVYIPHSYSPIQKTPVVIYLHGGGGNMQAAYKDGLTTYSDKYGFILLTPQGTSKTTGRYTWNTGVTTTDGVTEQGVGNPSIDDTGFIAKAISEIEQRYNIDPIRIYATGLSNGAAMANRLGCNLSEKIAAIAPVAGALEDACHPTRPIPVMLINGTNDLCHPYEGGQAECAKGILTFKIHHIQSAHEITRTWTSLNKCSATTTITYQKGNATCVTNPSCAGNTTVSLCTITGMGHTYPSGNQYLPAKFIGPVSYDISFDQIWDFFDNKHSQ